MTAEETHWREEFARTGTAQVRQNLLNPAFYNSEPRRNFALKWLREQERAAELRDHRMYLCTQWTLWAAVAAVIVGILSIVARLLH